MVASIRQRGSWAILWAGFLTLVIAAPWLVPGYLFGTDWPGPRRYDFPAEISSTAPLTSALATASRVASGEWTGKLFVLGLVFVAALTAFRAAPVNGFIPRAVASTIYVFNPFVYGRLHYGQLFLLAAYAAFPWAAMRFWLLLRDPALATGLLAAAGLAIIGIFSTHLFLIASILATFLVLSHLLSVDRQLAYVKRSGRWFLVAAGATIFASAYWLIPILIGKGPEARVIAATGSADLIAYATVPDRSLGLVPNLLGLYGFWAENTGRFTSMKAFIPFWPAVMAALLVISAIGAIAAFRRRPPELTSWVAGLLLAAAVGFVLEMGVSHPLTSGLVAWLDAHVPIYRGMRDAGKWAALLGLVYSQLGGLGAAAILAWLKKSIRNPVGAEWAGGFAAALMLALPLYYGNGLLFGMHGEIKPSQYPAGWYAADRVLVSDAHPGRTLVLPWHEYMRYSFIQNENPVVVSPASTFFSVPILSSANPEVPGIAPPGSADQVAVTGLVQEGSKGRWAEVLGSLNVKYILVAKELDWQSYNYLDTQSGLTRVADYGQILLFRNNFVP